MNMKQTIDACAANTRRLGFDVTQHATTIALIATEVGEALECLAGINLRHLHPEVLRYICDIQSARATFEEYREEATPGQRRDVATVADQEHLDEELADVVIRVFSYVGGNGRTEAFLKAIEVKMEKNRTRPTLHGKGF